VFGPVYRTYVLPEFDLAARKSHPVLGALGVRWRLGRTTSLWAVARGERVSPTEDLGPTRARTQRLTERR